MPLGTEKGLRNYCETTPSDNISYDHMDSAEIFTYNFGRTLYYQQIRICILKTACDCWHFEGLEEMLLQNELLV